MALFHNRRDAGRRIAEQLSIRDLEPDPIVIGLARGGVPVADEVGRRLQLPVDAVVVRKLGVPFQPELAFGAIATGDVQILNDEVVRAAGITDETIERISSREYDEMARREHYYRGGDSPISVDGRTVVLVDDGVATGASIKVAIEALRRRNPAQIIAAVPLAPPGVLDKLRGEADELICLRTPEPFGGVGAWYDDFGETTDDEVRRLLGGNSPTPNRL